MSFLYLSISAILADFKPSTASDDEVVSVVKALYRVTNLTDGKQMSSLTKVSHQAFMTQSDAAERIAAIEDFVDLTLRKTVVIVEKCEIEPSMLQILRIMMCLAHGGMTEYTKRLVHLTRTVGVPQPQNYAGVSAQVI